MRIDSRHKKPLESWAAVFWNPAAAEQATGGLGLVSRAREREACEHGRRFSFPPIQTSRPKYLQKQELTDFRTILVVVFFLDTESPCVANNVLPLFSNCCDLHRGESKKPELGMTLRSRGRIAGRAGNV